VTSAVGLYVGDGLTVDKGDEVPVLDGVDVLEGVMEGEAVVEDVSVAGAVTEALEVWVSVCVCVVEEVRVLVEEAPTENEGVGVRLVVRVPVVDRVFVAVARLFVDVGVAVIVAVGEMVVRGVLEAVLLDVPVPVSVCVGVSVSVIVWEGDPVMV